mmetsp:Transcript_150543/g.273929  ORF Transcript_150543/g.273929 Transcript_150543/m.273929 type:complete len:155 (-) Transcript_150543:142-606(-)
MHKVAFVFACLACAATVQGRELEAADALARLLLAQEQQAAFQPSGPGARMAAGTPKLARSRTLMKAPTDTAKMEGVELQRRALAAATALATALPALAGESKTYDVNPIFFALFMLYPFAVAIIKDIVVTEKDNPLVMSRGDLEEIGKIIGSKYT